MDYALIRERGVEVVRRYPFELLLVLLSLTIILISIGVFFASSHGVSAENEVSLQTEIQERPVQKTVQVEISGAVMKPDVYEVKLGTRLKDVLRLAGGLSEEADKGFFQRNVNLARRVIDQEKIYVPSAAEIASLVFIEKQRTLDYTQPQTMKESLIIEESHRVSINNGSPEEIDSLPGIGKTLAQKIIEGRPYDQTTDLVHRKVLTENQYSKIRDMISQ